MDINSHKLHEIIQEIEFFNDKDEKNRNNCLLIATGIITGKIKILNVTEELKDFLTNADAPRRATGIHILSYIFENLNLEILTSEELTFICDFYCKRLNDNHQVVPATLRGLLAISKMKNFPNDFAASILNGIFNHISCQQQQQSDRQTIYQIFIVLFDLCSGETEKMGLDFVYGVMSAIDGERDPRNLITLFKWLPKFLTRVHLEHLTEEMFEVIACYFPVDFRAPSKDPSNITRDELARYLCPCLCAIPEFAGYCLPLALEKLDSSVQIAKLDSLQLLKEGCKKFTTESYIDRSTEMLSSLQKEIFICSDKELEYECLTTLSLVLNKLSQGDQSAFETTVKNLIDTIKRNLLPDAKLFDVSSKILINVAKASEISASIVIREIIHVLINTYKITITPLNKSKMLKLLACFVTVYINIFHPADILNVNELKEIPGLCLEAIISNDNEIRLAGLDNLAVIASSVPAVIRNKFYDIFQKLIITEEAEPIRNAVLHCFKTFSNIHFSEMKEFIIQIQIHDITSLRLYLETLSSVDSRFPLHWVILPILTSYCVKGIPEATVACKCLRDMLDVDRNVKVRYFLVKDLNMINNFLMWTVDQGGSIIIKENQCLLENIMYVLTSLVGSLNEDEQITMLSEEIEKLLWIYKETNSELSVVLLNGLLIRLHKKVPINYEIINILIKFALHSQCEFVQNISASLLANILNKINYELSITTLSKYKCDTDTILSGSFEHEKALSNVSITTAWITKALYMRGHEQGSEWLDKLLELTKKYEAAAVGFRIIMSEENTALSRQSYCDIRVLYRQKFFKEAIQKLNECVDVESNFLKAAGYILEDTPENILLLHFKEVLRLIVLSLDRCTVPDVLIAILRKLNVILENGEDIMKEYVQVFLPKFLKLAKFKSSMNVRIAALLCIQKFTEGFPVYVLLPLKQEILMGLAECLDDPKRLVRREAVEARSRWYLLGAPI